MDPLYTIESVVPHAKPMSLLEAIVDYGDEWLQATARIEADNLFLVGQQVPAWVGIEYMAQTVAAWAGVHARIRGEAVQVGFLVGTRKYHASGAGFPLGCCLQITARRVQAGDNGLGIFDCSLKGIDEQGQTVEARASLNVYQSKTLSEMVREPE